MTDLAYKLILPRYIVTELADPTDTTATKNSLPDGEAYFSRPKISEGETRRRDGKARWMPTTFLTYPLVFCADGLPWDEANLFIFCRTEATTEPNMSTVGGVADDLACFRRFLDDVPEGAPSIDWLHFPPHKNSKPTYRYRGYLVSKVWANELKQSTANRQIGVVVRFYRWLLEQKLISLANPPWKEWTKYISVPRENGAHGVVEVKTTDLRITIAQQDDPFDGTIDDGGKLRPLTPPEQDWVVEALDALGNTEMTLIHLFALLTGARIQTVLTFKVRNILSQDAHATHILCPVGPGTGVDTKNNKKLQIFIPSWFANSLRTYALSARAKKRRLKAVGGDTPDQYLFLSVHGAPMYLGKEDTEYPMAKTVRHKIAGQAVRQNIREFILPYICTRHDVKFAYRFHDLRASYGMNIVDHFASKLEAGEVTYTEVLNFLRTRLGHESMVTTEGYLKHRSREKLVRQVQDAWETRLHQMSERAMSGAT